MHEVGIMQNALESALQAVRSAGATRIHSLQLRVGRLTGVVPDALMFAFEVVRQGTAADQATLTIESIPATCWCGRCQLEFVSEDFACECPQCGEVSSELRRGLELELGSLEVS